ncbi:hypothetical protein [Chitinibacter sp. S2-10]|uniref:hypothetical protein n=1 Tax=Chitinibacter sp. S2-10 TaxID=3373597 RepID=UPI0039774012
MKHYPFLIAASLVVMAAPVAVAMDSAMDSGKTALSRADQKLIKSAMKAAPKKVSAQATIVAMSADGQMRTLRSGSNGFTCMPDNPATPGPDPMCMDKAAWEWAGAWMAHKTPASGKIGFMYMLSGGTDASNTDPYATKPAADNHWVKTGPHVMIVGAEASFYDMYPKNAAPDTTVPYVMWPGTPYQHLMIPVK